MYSVEDFYNRVESCKSIICFGVGHYFKDFIKKFQGQPALNKIIACVDNNTQLHGTYVCIEDKKIVINSIEWLKTIDMKNSFVLITCARPAEIMDQLQVFDAKIEYYCYSIIKNLIEENNALKEWMPNSIRLTETPVIPKKIHYCWFGRNPIPDKYKYWMDSWHKLCPDYEIIEWNENTYDITKNTYMLQAYEAKKWGFVPDYARLDIIYQHGGIYLDTDVELVKNLDDLLYQKGFVGFECYERVNFGSGFGAVKGLQIIKELRDFYDELDFKKENGDYNLVASPKIQTEYLKRKGLYLNGHYQIVDELTILPEKVLCGKGLNTRTIRNTEHTMSIHHYDASWISDKDRKNFQKLQEEMKRDIKRK